jgi:predicted DNA-binding transcriptional regulator YafY
MVPAIVPLRFEDALSLLHFAKGSAGGDKVASIDLPQHHVPVRHARDILRAVLSENAVDIYYFSVHSGTEGWRTIVPHAFAYDGYRWHARAFCLESNSHRDFVLGRITKVREATGRETKIPVDQDWNHWVSIKFRAFPDLNDAQRSAIERDFGMKSGIGTLKVRRAMLHYTLVYLGMHPQPERFSRLALVAPIPSQNRAGRV